MITPFLAPIIGKEIASYFDWRAIFLFLLFFSVINLVWFIANQNETLDPENKNVSGIFIIFSMLIHFLKNIHAFGYTIIAGLLFGIQLTYISLASVYFSDLYMASNSFVYYFGFMSSAYGCALVLNGILVVSFGMHRLTLFALFLILSVGFSILICNLINFHISLNLFIFAMYLLMFGTGIIFGNIISMAMEPLGRVAGLGGAFSASISSLIAISVSYFIGLYYNHSLFSFGVGISICSIFSLVLLNVAKNIPLKHIEYRSIGFKFN